MVFVNFFPVRPNAFLSLMISFLFSIKDPRLMVFLDFCKAFDHSHKVLLLKLNKLNLGLNVFSWIESFLTNRTQHVSTNQANSHLSAATSGVPQGSILGPRLFLICINNLPQNLSSPTSLFANDCVIYQEITNESDAPLL